MRYSRRRVVTFTAYDCQKRKSQHFWVKSTPQSHTSKTRYRNFEANITRKGTAPQQSQFVHSCFCERFIYIPLIGLPILLQGKGGPNVEIGTEASKFFFWEHINSNFFAVQRLICQYQSCNIPGSIPASSAEEAALNIRCKEMWSYDSQELWGLRPNFCCSSGVFSVRDYSSYAGGASLQKQKQAKFFACYWGVRNKIIRITKV